MLRGQHATYGYGTSSITRALKAYQLLQRALANLNVTQVPPRSPRRRHVRQRPHLPSLLPALLQQRAIELERHNIIVIQIKDLILEERLVTQQQGVYIGIP